MKFLSRCGQKVTMKTHELIDVAVALPVHGSFVYSVPEHLDAMAEPGMRVLVPFGPRRVTGYLLARGQESRGYQVKHILDLPDDAPLFPEAMIPLFRWVARYYIHPLGEVIKTALPVGLNQYDVSVVSLGTGGEDALAGGNLTPGETLVLEILKSRGSLRMKQLKDKTRHPGVTALVRRMAARGLVEVRSELRKDQVKMKTERFISLKQMPAGTVVMSAKRKALLALLQERGDMSLSRMKQDIPRAPHLIKPLAEGGYLEVSERQVFRDPLGDPVEPDVPPELTDEQKSVVEEITSCVGTGFHRFLVSGVTGSGKTEVYMRLVQESLNKGLGAIVLVPEISLISQTERRFRARFGNRIAVLHSALSKGELLDQWMRIVNREAMIVIGPRSSVFAPLETPGIIIVDEEHDPSYKQETGLKYNARDLAVVRAQQGGAVVVLGSATPSAQSYYNAVNGRFRELKLLNRVNRNPLPVITLVDLKKYKDYRGHEKLITPELSKEIRACLERGEQALIFLNRRGFATWPVCDSCGETFKCKFCELTMTLHLGENVLRCHLCGFTLPARSACLHCGSPRVSPLGFGTEKIENLLKTLFPDARVARLDQDTGSKKGATVALLKKIRHRTVDIVVGTQMLAKGHDFPWITLVGVICADMSLNFPDFRAGERTFQLLAQVAGRAGRGTATGKVIMQTYNPDHFSIEASRNQNFMEFFQEEFPFREALGYPPFARMIQLIISGEDKDRTAIHAREVGEILKRGIDEEKAGKDAQLLGPIEAGIPKIAKRYRWQILLKGRSASLLNRLVAPLARDSRCTARQDVHVAIDVDPYYMM